jgi:hypothetical protein
MDLFALFPPERWYEESLAYIDSSFELFGRMTRGEFVPNWPRAKAAAFLFGHGLELFFKAAIAQAGGQIAKLHDLKELHSRYRERFPENEFLFQSDVAGFITENEPLPFYEFLKYPERISEIGKKWNAGIYFDLDRWYNATGHTRDDLTRLWPLILARHPRDASRWTNNPDGKFEPRKKRKKGKKK